MDVHIYIERYCRQGHNHRNDIFISLIQLRQVLPMITKCCINNFPAKMLTVLVQKFYI